MGYCFFLTNKIQIFKFIFGYILFLIFQLDSYQHDWLRNSGWNSDNNNIILIHGYAGGDDTLPISVLRDGKNFIFIQFVNKQIKKKLIIKLIRK